MKKKDFIVQDLMSKIYQNKYKVFDSLPPERELMNIYSVSRNTIRSALKKLIDIGMIVPIQGKGNILQPYNKNTSLLYSSITEKKSDQIRSIVNYLKLEESTEKDKRIFDIKVDDKVWSFQRIRIVDSKAMEIQTSRLPQTIFKDIELKDIEESIQKLVLDMELDISHSIATMEAILLNSEEARMLYEKKNTAAMKVISRGILKDGLVFEYTERVIIDYKGTFKLPFSKDSYDRRH